MAEEDKPGPNRCQRGYTRDDLRHFLFMREAGAVYDVDAEQVAQHLQQDDCFWCPRESEFLYWTEPGLSVAGLSRYERLMNGLEAEDPSGIEPTPINAKQQTGAQPAEQVRDREFLEVSLPPGSTHAHDALSLVRKVLSQKPTAEQNMEQYCRDIVEAVEICFPIELSDVEVVETEKKIRPEFRKYFDRLDANLKNRAWDLFGSRSSRPKGQAWLRRAVEEDEPLMLAVTLQLASLFPGARPFPLSLRDGRVLLNEEAWCTAIQARLTPASVPQAGTSASRLSNIDV